MCAAAPAAEAFLEWFHYSEVPAIWKVESAQFSLFYRSFRPFSLPAFYTIPLESLKARAYT
jgi:hypothetical protein